MLVEPIDAGQQQAVRLATESCLRRAGGLCRRDFASIPVSFDLTGRSAGMYRVRNGRRSIRYNAYLFAKYFEDNLAVTVPHEVAHYVTDMLHGLHRVRPHGMEWQAVMRSLGVEPRACADYDLSGVPVRRLPAIYSDWSLLIATPAANVDMTSVSSRSFSLFGIKS